MRRKKIVSFLLAAVLLIAMAACGQQSETPASGDAAPGASGDAAAPAEAAGEFTYPMEPITLRVNVNPIDMSTIPEWAKDNFFWDEAQRRTGVTLEFIGAEPDAMAANEQFTLLLASGDYPDIFRANWFTFPGGPTTAIDQGYIIPLTGQEQYMPNFIAAMEKEPQIRKDVTTDDGVLYNFPYYAHERAVAYSGLVIREDWLAQIGREVPVTVDDMYQTLTAFKNELNVPAPLTFEYRWLFLENAASSLSNPWKVDYPFYVVDDVVRFGPLEPGYKDFLVEMNKWYNEGLIDRDMPSVDKATVEAKISGGESGVVINQSSNTMNAVLANKDNPEYTLGGVSTLVMNEGDERMFGQRNNNYSGAWAWSISSQCENVEAAIRFCDYFWGEEGRMLVEYGTEGVSYEVADDGTVTLTDLVMNNPDGAIPRSAREYFGLTSSFPFRGTDFDLGYDQWMLDVKAKQGDNNMAKYILPPIVHTAEESAAITESYSNIDAYCREMIVKYIIGTESFDNWDAFIETINSYGMPAVLETKQAAYERYLAR